MRVEVVNTGTELLLGAVVNSHLAYFGERLFGIGLRVDWQVTVPDGAAIRDALLNAFERDPDVVLVTGGLGPTSDDLTREIVAELLGRRLVRDDGVLAGIRALCKGRGFAFQERMGRQAMVPEGAVVLPNASGTAPGLYLSAVEAPSWRSPHLFLLPGPPRELRRMFEAEVLPRLADLNAGAAVRECRTFRCVGIGESVVEARLGARLDAVAGLEVGYCARPNEVDLRLIGESAVLDSVEAEVRAELGEYLVTLGGEGLETVVVGRLVERGLTLATAESCT
ncbi:MAG: molybdopterin-binding protein, partial [Chthoniobacterales bacterium]